MSTSDLDNLDFAFNKEAGEESLLERMIRENESLKAELYKTQQILQITTQAYLLAHAESLSDPLTGVYNRRCMMATLENILDQSREKTYQLQSVIIAIDLDKFKIINDTYGHEVGDQALCLVASTLQNTVRKTDIVARRSGDEFIIILNDCDDATAAKKVEDIRTMFKNLSLEHNGHAIPLSGSVGWHMVDKDLSASENLGRADHHLYVDKNAVNDNKTLYEAVITTTVPSP
jgi:two-component system cell cycle response regulator